MGPAMSVSGVRNSWLTLLKNVVFARSSSASIWARRRSSSDRRATASAAATLDPTNRKKSRYASSARRRGLMPATSHDVGDSPRGPHTARRRPDRSARATVPRAADRATPAPRSRRSRATHERPERASARTELSRRNGITRLDAAGAHQRRRSAVAGSGVEKGEREIFGVACEDGRRRGEHVGDARRLLGDPAEIAQQPQPALTDHAPRRLADDAEHAVHAPGLVAHRDRTKRRR